MGGGVGRAVVGEEIGRGVGNVYWHRSRLVPRLETCVPAGSDARQHHLPNRIVMCL